MIAKLESTQTNIPDKKRKAPLRLSLLRSPFNTKMLKHEISIPDQILLKLKFDVDEYLCFPCVGTKHIMAKDKGVLEALIQRYCLRENPRMFYISKV